jgi:hypothetical protein
MAGEDSVEVPAGENCCIGEHLIIAFDVRETHLLVQQKLVQFGLAGGDGTAGQIVEVLAYLEDDLGESLFAFETVVEI